MQFSYGGSQNLNCEEARWRTCKEDACNSAIYIFSVFNLKLHLSQSHSVSLKAAELRQSVTLDEFLPFSAAPLIPSLPQHLILNTPSSCGEDFFTWPPLMLLERLFIAVWRTFKIFPQGHHRSIQNSLTHPPQPICQQ